MGALLVGFNAKLNCVAHLLSLVAGGLVAWSALMEAMMIFVIFLFKLNFFRLRAFLD